MWMLSADDMNFFQIFQKKLKFKLLPNLNSACKMHSKMTNKPSIGPVVLEVALELEENL